MSFTDAWRVVWKSLQEWWDSWVTLLLFGLVWVLCCATIVLGPPATFGFFHAVRWLMAKNETRWDQYFQMGKKHLLTSWLWFITNIFVITVVYANYIFYGALSTDIGRILQGIALGAGFIWVAVQFYALPYYVLLEKKSLITAWKNGLFTILASPFYSLVLWLVLFVIILLHLTILPILLGGPGLVVLLASIAVEDRIIRFGIRERNA